MEPFVVLVPATACSQTDSQQTVQYQSCYTHQDEAQQRPGSTCSGRSTTRQAPALLQAS